MLYIVYIAFEVEVIRVIIFYIVNTFFEKDNFLSEQ